MVALAALCVLFLTGIAAIWCSFSVQPLPHPCCCSLSERPSPDSCCCSLSAWPSPTPPLLAPPPQCLFLDLVTLLQPNHFKLLVATRSLAPQPDEGVHAQWQAVVSTLCLTPAQLRGLRAEWQAFLAIQAQLAGAANAAAAGVAAAAPAQTPQCATGSQQLPSPAAAAAAVEQPAASMAAQVERYVQLAERVGELAAAADAHWAALLAFSDATWYMLTPLQGARLLAACRPFYPDPIQLVRALLEAEVEEAGGGEVASTGVAWSWRRQAAEHQRGSGALRSGMFPSNLLSL